MLCIRKNDKIAFILAIIIVTIVVAVYFFRENRLKHEGVYVIGSITSVDDFENGYWTKIKYKYKGKDYTFTYNALPRINEKNVFLEISSSNPNLCKLIRDVKVPFCITLESMPLNGWDKIPDCR